MAGNLTGIIEMRISFTFILNLVTIQIVYVLVRYTFQTITLFLAIINLLSSQSKYKKNLERNYYGTSTNIIQIEIRCIFGIRKNNDTERLNSIHQEQHKTRGPLKYRVLSLYKNLLKRVDKTKNSCYNIINK